MEMSVRSSAFVVGYLLSGQLGSSLAWWRRLRLLKDTKRVFRNGFEKTTQNRHEIGSTSTVSVPFDAKGVDVWETGMLVVENGPQILVQFQWV